jgi:hypothetical protein
MTQPSAHRFAPFASRARFSASGAPRFARFGAAALALFAVLAAPEVARAQVVYVEPPPPPPPPPPGYYGGYGYHRRAPYYEESRHAFDLGFDFEGTIPLNIPTLPDGNQIQGGSGFKVRFGDQIRLDPQFRITIEGGWAYDHMFAADNQGNAYSWDTDRIFGGARFGFGRFVSPSVYGHLGVGWRNTGDPSVAQTSGFAADFGGAIDFRLGHHFQLGAHLEYATLNTPPYAPQWLAIGAHLDFVF